MNTRRARLAGWVCLVGCAVVAGCGGGTDASPTAPSPTPVAATAGPTSAGTSGDARLTDDLGGRPLLPPDNWWNQDISNAPLDPQSDAFIDSIGRTRTSHPDFGPPPYGIPYVSVGGSQPRLPVTFARMAIATC